MQTNGTAIYARQHKRGLTLPQLSAVDLVAAGKTDKETAELLELHRTTVTKWRLYDPVFQAALNRRRAEIWGAGIDRLRSLVPKALEALAYALEHGKSASRVKAAVEILRLAQVPVGAVVPSGPTEPDAVIAKLAEKRRQEARDPQRDLLAKLGGFGTHEQRVVEVLDELESRANDLDEAASEPKQPPVHPSNLEVSPRVVLSW